MRLTLKPTLMLIALPILAACTSTAGPSLDQSQTKPPVVTRPTVTPQMEFSTLQTERSRLMAAFDDNRVTPSREIPLSGRATYEGVAAVVVPTERSTQLLGDARLDVDFTNDRFSGSAGNFVGGVNGGAAQDWSGGLNFTNGTINAGRNFVLGSGVSGVLTSGGNRLQINGQMGGNFQTGEYGEVVGGAQLGAEAGTSMVLNNRAYVVPIGGASNNGIHVIAER